MWLANWVPFNLESVLSHSESLLIHIKSVNQSGDYQCQSDSEYNEKLKQIVSVIINGKMILSLILEKCAFQIELFVGQNVALEMCFCMKTKIYK